MRPLWAAVLLLGMAGCVNLPPTVERELDCPDTQAVSHYGEDLQCVARR